MDIKKFKLLGEGFTGIEIKGTDLKHKEGSDVMIDLKITYKVPVQADLVSLLQGLRYYFLIITDLLPEQAEDYFDHKFNLPMMVDWDKKFDKGMYAHSNKLMQNCFITGFRYDRQNILVTAKMKGADDYTYAINTPNVSFDTMRTDISDNMQRLVIDIKKAITEFVDDVKLRKMPAKQYLMDLFQKDEEMQNEVRSMTDEAAEKLQIEKLQEKGFIVFKGEEVMAEIHEIATEPEMEPEVSNHSHETLPEEPQHIFEDDVTRNVIGEIPEVTAEDTGYIPVRTEAEAKEWALPATASPVPQKRAKMVPHKTPVQQEA